jgi:iron(III) transport system substrate-binding protein
MRLQRLIVTGLATILLAGCGGERSAPDAGGGIVVYSGRSQSLVAPVVQLFERESGIRVQVKYGNTAQLALALQEEGEATQADVFWAQDAGALGAVAEAGLFASLPADVAPSVPAIFRHGGGKWVATSGRARVLAYSSERAQVDALPRSVHDLTGERYRGRVGWAPANASFQSFVTALRAMEGEAAAEAWLRAMQENGAKAYDKNTAIIEAIVAGEVDFGLPNHYYLLRYKKADARYPVEQTFFAPGDAGNLVNVAGVGVLAVSKHPEAAQRFVRFLLSPAAQQYFASDVMEYPVTESVVPSASLVPRDSLERLAPAVDLNALDDLEGTLALLRKVGLL